MFQFLSPTLLLFNGLRKVVLVFQMEDSTTPPHPDTHTYLFSSSSSFFFFLFGGGGWGGSAFSLVFCGRRKLVLQTEDDTCPISVSVLLFCGRRKPVLKKTTTTTKTVYDLFSASALFCGQRKLVLQTKNDM